MTSLEAAFGPLELRVLEALWRQPGPATVRDLHGDFPAIAYTTLMTTLDRLHRKGVLDRQKEGRAFAYWPRTSRDALQSQLAHATLADLLQSDQQVIRPIMSMFVDAVSAKDAALLDELEALVREKRDGAAPDTAAKGNTKER
jgi:predicted transcriptional regulator